MNFELELAVRFKKTVFLQRNKNKVFILRFFPFYWQNLFIGKSTKNISDSPSQKIYSPSFTWVDTVFVDFCHRTFTTFCANSYWSLCYEYTQH